MKHAQRLSNLRSLAHAINRQRLAGERIKSFGQETRISYEPQSGAFSFPAKVVDAQTRALIDAALYKTGA